MTNATLAHRLARALVLRLALLHHQALGRGQQPTRVQGGVGRYF